MRHRTWRATRSAGEAASTDGHPVEREEGLVDRARDDAVSRPRSQSRLRWPRSPARISGVLAVLASATLSSAPPARADAPAAAGAQADARVAGEQRWTWPLGDAASVSQGFVPPASRYGSGHRGADLPGASGEPVLAAAGGVVSYAGRLAGRGVVVVSHGELRTTYEPVASSVVVGAVVVAGEQLGQLEPAHPGCPVGACLHWGLRRGQDYLDPVDLVRRRPARLLPLGPGRDGPGPGTETEVAVSWGAAQPGAAGATPAAPRGSGAASPPALQQSRWSGPPTHGALAASVVTGVAATAVAGGLRGRRRRVD